MKKLSNFRQIVLWGITISLLFNVSILLLFFYLMEIFQVTTVAITGLFLVFFLFVLQPIRDQLLVWVTEKIIFATQLRMWRLEEKASEIANLEEGIAFLASLANQWQLLRIRLVLYVPRPEVIFITAHGSRVRKVASRRQENQEFFAYLKNSLKAQNTHDFPPGIRHYLYNRKVRCVIPISFRDNLFGFIGLPLPLEESKIEILAIAAQRLGLAIENERLKSSTRRSALLKKEFFLARRVENFLSRTEFTDCHHYRIERLENFWKKKYFAVIFEVARFSLGNLESNPFFLILVRLSSSSIRANALQLFAVQGYFLALATATPSVELLAEQLQLSLATIENGKITLDGFLLAIEPEDLRMVYFGSHLAIKTEKEWQWLPDSSPLGSLDYSLQVMSLGRPANLHVSIREYPLISLTNIGL